MTKIARSCYKLRRAMVSVAWALLLKCASVENVRLRDFELAGDGFGQALFQSGGKPLLQHNLLLRREGEELQAGALFVVAPADFGFDVEMKFLPRQRESYFHLYSRSERRAHHHSQSAFTDVHGLAADIFRAFALDLRIRHKRTTEVASAFAHDQSKKQP